MAGGLFVTGTDTGVGKTLVTCLVAAGLRASGHRVAVMKPIETGCAVGESGRLRAADAELLRFFAGATDPMDLVCPIRFAEPLAPAVAAARERTEIDVGRIAAAFEQLTARADVVLVEGAGGLLVPIATDCAMADLARRLRLPLLVVVGSKLGALNHALLTMECARARQVAVAGYVVNFPFGAPDLAGETNVETLASLIGPPLAIVPHLAGGIRATEEHRAELARRCSERFDVDRLLRAARW